ncbi:MAG: thioredoxin-disulfide reductase [Deltaproteobacteria bacterium CG23_combo_of_CG06-09_8_20_14_all_60_8]|nr:MAG: thioredoxin-disulfide reductase [Desulfobacterales bacterium CG2_30_60_27]PIP44518.1 MAG: thioredoxin-disulfide reductase [Deltaproteobacteria bacterium CG23_combo_of_CG06-09_8_20_14_all_60_8]
MPTSELYDLIIVGGGPAGLTAGIYAMRAAMKTVLVEKGLAGGQVNNTDIVENWPGLETISGAALAANFLRHAASYGLPVKAREIVAVEPGLRHHTVRLDNGEELRAHAIILGMGGSPKKLGVPGEDANYGKGVSYCATCDGFFFRNKEVLVVGGGDSATEEALYLTKLATKVTIVHRRDALRASMILQQRVQAQPKINILWNTVITAIRSENGGVTGAALQDVITGRQRDLAADGIFIFIGFSPNNQLVPAGTLMNANGFVASDAKCETNMPGIFVVGDLREKYARQIVTAAGDGCTAALAAAHYVENQKTGG